MGELKSIQTSDLEIACYTHGPEDGPPVILLHGFPYDTRAYDEVARKLSAKGLRCFVPYLRGYGPTRFPDDQTMRSGQQAALGYDLLSFMDALDIPTAILGGYDWGGRAACIVAALWPERVSGLVSCGQGYNIQDIANARQPAPPDEEERYWYQYYFHTQRGEAGLTQRRAELCQHIWKIWSPSWGFEQATYDATAPSFNNPDFVQIVIHSYTHRFGGVAGDPKFDDIEAQLAMQPGIVVPTVVLQGRDDGVDPPSAVDHDKPHFTGPYRRQVIDGVGHNFPQESPAVFAKAILSLV